MSNILGLRRNKALDYLNGLSDSLWSVNGRLIDAVPDETLLIGNAVARNFDDKVSHIRVGIAGLSGKSRFPFAHVDDLAFTKSVVCLYHEYGHYLQNYGPNKDVPSMISEVSVIGNPKYYTHAWKELPHEIRAEGMGVSLAWNAMESAFPGKADTCLLPYINYRADNTAYMLPAKQGGYHSKDEVMAAFETAMDKSLMQPREPQGSFLRYPDESVRLVTQDCRNIQTSPNYYHVDKLIDRMPGEQKDRMMASLVLQLHPDILEERPALKPEKLSVEHEFGKPLVVTELPGKHASNGYNTQIEQALEICRRVDKSSYSNGFEPEY